MYFYRLRDVTSEQEAELNKKIKTLEKELASLQDIQGYFLFILYFYIKIKDIINIIFLFQNILFLFMFTFTTFNFKLILI